MKSKIITFINELIIYDYILFGTVFLLFLLLITLSIVLRKRVGLSIFILLLSFATLFIAPLIGYSKLHEYIFKNEIILKSQKRLLFTPAIVLKGSVENISKVNFKECKIVVDVHKASKNNLKNYLYSFKSIKKMSIFEDNIKKGEIRNFKIIVEPFYYKKDYNISIKGSCR